MTATTLRSWARPLLVLCAVAVTAAAVIAAWALGLVAALAVYAGGTLALVAALLVLTRSAGWR